MSELRLETLDGRTAFEPGEEIRVIAAWRLDRSPEALELRLAWHTSGKGDEDVSVVQRLEIARPDAEGLEQLDLRLPGVPYSYHGKLISIQWTLELVVLPKGDAAALDIVIGPGAAPIETTR